MDKNRADLKSKYADSQTFIKKFDVTDEMLADMVEAGKSEKVELNEEQYAKSKELLRTFLKAAIANDLFNTSAYFQVVNDRNDIFQEALRIINDDARYKKLLSPQPTYTSKVKTKK